ncbi:MAG: U3 snoRNP protein [Vezdaea aestivalis]|nr:MAG: U3 snoRNP protein [Vezdaea aestivalis]
MPFLTSQKSSNPSSLLEALSTVPSSFLLPTQSLNSAALDLAKQYLDPVATSVLSAQDQRVQHARKKRKKSEPDPAGNSKLLKLDQLYVHGFDTTQVWEQAKRILQVSNAEAQQALAEYVPNTETSVEMVQFGEDGFELGSGSDSDVLEVNGGKDADEMDLGHNIDFEGFSDDQKSDVDDVSVSDAASEASNEPVDVYVSDPNGLNDGFFSIDDFNRQSEFLEQQDAAGDNFAGQASDEENIDWDADPATYLPQDLNVIKKDDRDGDSSEDDEDGPTFGNVDLNGIEDSDSDQSDMEELEEAQRNNTNDILYADFFAPPARKVTQISCPRPSKASLPHENDLDRTVAEIRRDLYSESPEPSSESDAQPSRTPGQAFKSSHEKRRAKLASEIRKLEAESVAKRSWVMSGEAGAFSRPLNSLLEEDLDFERAGKPLPLPTLEASADIESLIKRRIANYEFDELRRRRPEAVLAEARDRAIRRGLEVSDQKDELSLAQLYEQDHLEKANPKAEGEVDAATKKAREEAEVLWKQVAGKLDALSNAHFKPRVPKPEVTVVSDVRALEIEDARPAGAEGGLGLQSRLAPQEVWRPGMAAEEEPLKVGKDGVPVGKTEVGRDQKRRERRREKARKKKSLGTRAVAPKGDGDKPARSKVVEDLKRGRVGVIGKKGEITDVHGRDVKGKGVIRGAAALKL